MATLKDKVPEALRGETRPGGLNREMIGERYELPAREVGEDEMIAFARAIEDTNPRHVDTRRAGGIIASPLFPQRLLHRAMEEALTDENLNADLLRLVHGEQDMRLFQPLRPGDRCAARGEIAGIEQKSTGELLRVRMWLDCDGEITSEATAALFIRAPERDSSPEEPASTPDKSASKQPRQRLEVGDREILFRDSQKVSSDQPARYAEASGDHNPIHTDPEVARAAGLPDVILHGMCTMAFAANAIVEGACAGDSTRLSRIKVRFSRPVFPGQTVTTRAWLDSRDDGLRRLNFSAHVDDQRPVLTHGLAEVRSSA